MISAFRRRAPEDHKLEASLGDTARLSLINKTKSKMNEGDKGAEKVK